MINCACSPALSACRRAVQGSKRVSFIESSLCGHRACGELDVLCGVLMCYACGELDVLCKHVLCGAMPSHVDV
jgi:hypothetical protein